MRAGVLILVGLLLGADDPTDRPSYEALKREYAAAEALWNARFDGPMMADPRGVGAIERYRDWPAWAFAPRFLAIAESDPKAPGAFESLVWLARLNGQVGAGDGQLFSAHSRALDLLSESYADDPRLKDEPDVFWPALTPSGERFLRRVATSRDRELRGIATLRLGQLLNARAKVRHDPWYAKPDRSAFQSFLAGRFDPGFLRYIAETDADTAEAESVRLVVKAQQEYGDAKYRKTTIGGFAASVLAEWKAPREGK